MALKQIDVLQALSDPILQRMDFSVDGLRITSDSYRKIFELIRDEQILIVEGNDPDKAVYNPAEDTLTTQSANSPADLFNRSMLIHECTHAIKDMDRVTITALGNEAAAYMAQGLYLLLSNPQFVPAPGWGHVKAAMTLVQSLKLDKNPGVGKRIRYDDILTLVKRINDHPAYHQDRSRLSIADGISPKPRKFLDVPGSPEQTAMKAQYSSALAHRVPSDAMFDTDKYDIKSGAEPALLEAGDYIREFQGRGDQVYITGHTDSTGSPAHNLTLSRQRANAVAQWLTRNGLVEPARVSIDGVGATRPIAPNTDPAGRARNRRVEILIM